MGNVNVLQQQGEPRDVRGASLNQAYRLITGDRAASYGDFTTEAIRLGRAWAALLDIEDIDPHVVAAMLAALKLVRATNPYGPAHLDNWVDAAGYIGLGAQVDVDTRGA
jgi:hypothetical protein